MELNDDFFWSLLAGALLTTLLYGVGKLSSWWGHATAAGMASIIGLPYVYYFGPPVPGRIFNAGDNAARIYSGLHVGLCSLAWIAAAIVMGYVFRPRN